MELNRSLRGVEGAAPYNFNVEFTRRGGVAPPAVYNLNAFEREGKPLPYISDKLSSQEIFLKTRRTVKKQGEDVVPYVEPLLRSNAVFGKIYGLSITKSRELHFQRHSKNEVLTR